MIRCHENGLFDLRFSSNEEFCMAFYEYGFNYCPYCGKSIGNHISLEREYEIIMQYDDFRLCIHGNNKDLCVCSKLILQ